MKLSEAEIFQQDVKNRIATNGQSTDLLEAKNRFMATSLVEKYSYNFSWLGRPIIQYPQDIVALQQLVWTCQPDLIIETGIAHGGSLILSASLLELNALCGGPNSAKVLGIDIDIRKHNRHAIEQHPMSKRINMIEGSSIAPEVISQVVAEAEGKNSVLVLLDSNHTHEHVLAELEAYAPLVSQNSYCIVYDTIVEHAADSLTDERPWGVGDNPQTALNQFMQGRTDFEIDTNIDNQLLISVAPTGYLKRVN